MGILQIIVDGTPVAYSRPRFRSKLRPRGVGTPQAHRALRDLTRLVAGAVTDHRQSGAEWDPRKPAKVTVEFQFPRPKSMGGRGRGHGRTVILVEQIKTEPVGVADVDNLIKLVLEGLQHGGAVENDRLVVVLHARKLREEGL